MLIKILAGLAIVVVLFLGYVALKPSDFHIVREIKINAPPEVIFDQVNNLHKFDSWNPWSKIDPNAKQTYEGPESGVGAASAWDGNNEVGSGRMSIVDSQPNSVIRMKLEFIKPFPGISDVEFTFKPEGAETITSWSMVGHSSFIPRAFCTLLNMNMDKMIGDQFEKGLSQLKTITETKP